MLEHEFIHIMQFGASAYYSQEGRWYWEASADWFADFAVPEAGLDAQNAVQFLLLPELPLDYFEPGNLSSLANMHQYSSSVFLVATTELAKGDWTRHPRQLDLATGDDVPSKCSTRCSPGAWRRHLHGVRPCDDARRAVVRQDGEQWLEDYQGSDPLDEAHADHRVAEAEGSEVRIEIDPSRLPGRSHST